MSQAKVDKYKEEKKNRAKTLKRQKAGKVIGILVAALGVGAIIGIPLGKYIYNTKKAEEERSRTVTTANYDTWFDEFWGKHYSGDLAGTNVQDLIDQVGDSTNTDAITDDEDAIDLGDVEVGEDGEINLDDLDLEDAGE
jgi:hypothetical protein